MSEFTTQEVTAATNLHGTADSESSADATTPLAPASFSFQKLPLDIARMIYDWLPEPELRPLLKTSDGFTLYAEVWTVPQGLLLANKFFRKDITAHVEEYIAKKPIVVYWHLQPHSDAGNIDYAVGMLLDLFHHGQLYDARNVNKLTGMSRASFDKWTLKAPILHYKRSVTDRAAERQNAFNRRQNTRNWNLQLPVMKYVIEWHLDEAVVEIFYRQSLAKLRHQPKSTVEVRGLVQDASQIHPKFQLREQRSINLPLNPILVALTGLSTDGETEADSKMKRRLANKLERELLEQLSS
jgi:hypothetical protein